MAVVLAVQGCRTPSFRWAAFVVPGCTIRAHRPREQRMEIVEFELTSEHVDEVLKACMYGDDEPTDGHIDVEGVLNTYRVDPERVEAAKPKIAAMLSQLPYTFRRDSGGGWSFLNACMREDGVQWTGLHLQQERLMVLGIAAGMVEILMPRAMWPAVGGVPYFAVTIS